MYMPLVSHEAGVVTFSKPAGSVLLNGDVIGNLKLDDLSKVKRAVPFSGALPSFGYFFVVSSSKSNSR